MNPKKKEHLFVTKGKSTHLNFKTWDHNEHKFEIKDIKTGKVGFLNVLLSKVFAVSHLKKVDIDNIQLNLEKDFLRFLN